MDLANSIVEFFGEIEILKGLVRLKVFGKVYLRVLLTFWASSTVLLCRVMPVMEVGIL